MDSALKEIPLPENLAESSGNFLDHEPQRKQEILEVWKRKEPLSVSDIVNSVVDLTPDQVPARFTDNLSLIQPELISIRDNEMIPDEEKERRFQAVFQSQSKEATLAMIEEVVEPKSSPTINQPTINHLAYYLLNEIVRKKDLEASEAISSNGSLIQRVLIYSLLNLDPTEFSEKSKDLAKLIFRYGSLFNDVRSKDLESSFYGTIIGSLAGVDALLSARNHLVQTTGVRGQNDSYDVMPADREMDCNNKIDGVVTKNGKVVAFVQAKSHSEIEPKARFATNSLTGQPAAALNVYNLRFAENQSYLSQAVPLLFKDIKNTDDKLALPRNNSELAGFVDGVKRQVSAWGDVIDPELILVYHTANFARTINDIKSGNYSHPEFMKDIAQYLQDRYKTLSPV